MSFIAGVAVGWVSGAALAVLVAMHYARQQQPTTSVPDTCALSACDDPPAFVVGRQALCELHALPYDAKEPIR